jgi:hypothetical protein
MEAESLRDAGQDLLAQGVAGLISAYVAEETATDRSRPRSFAPVGIRLMRTRETSGRRRVLVACALVVAAVSIPIRLHPGAERRQALTYTVDGKPPSSDGYVGAAPAVAPVLSFSDGTRVRLAPQAQGRVLEVGRQGARIALDEGDAEVEVVHRSGAEWLFEAGPFVISVHGTAFSFGWDTRASRLDVKMKTGVVSVTGPLSGGEIFLRAGQTLSISLNERGSPHLEPGPGGSSPASSPLPEPATAPAPFEGSGEPSSRSTARSRLAESWAALLADGESAAVIDDAERIGLGRVLDSSNSEELAALADASRYERREGLARRALLAQRRRFPRSMRAREASFLLGRLDQASTDGAERALGWYDQYLQESPDGTYVSETLGRKMMIMERTQRHREAMAIAEDYLRLYPAGTYCHAAKALVRAP